MARVIDDGWLETDSRMFACLGEVITPGREEVRRVLLDHVLADREEPFWPWTWAAGWDG